MLTHFEDIDWDHWTPQEHATFLFVREADRVLLIRKKRGLGAGKINGPGGRLDDGESSMQCAIREVQEELLVTPIGVEAHGELAFQFVDGYALYVHVFSASGCDGEPQETDEAEPLWFSLDAIPFDEMWADDRLWFPYLLSGQQFYGRFLFDDDTLLGYEVVAEDTKPGEGRSCSSPDCCTTAASCLSTPQSSAHGFHPCLMNKWAEVRVIHISASCPWCPL